MLAEWKVRGFQQVAATQEIARVVSSDPKAPGVVAAPISGNVTYIYRQPGEKVLAGEPLATVSAAASDRIVGFLRQPIRIQPREGWQVLIRPRARAGAVRSRILKSGPQLVPIRPSLLPAAQVRTELGLPLIVAVPAGLKLYPGEIVDLRLLPAPPAPPPKPPRPAPAPKPRPGTNAPAAKPGAAPVKK
jgi:pyruvate/2-oxoglutarate dehydrogenase complex dihydrolipoamide acyltransferase (E2) component